MKDYSNINYMPNDFEYLNRLYNIAMPNAYPQAGTCQTNNIYQGNMGQNTGNIALKQKLATQAGDNMNFNKCKFNQNNVDPNSLYDVYGGFIRGNMFPDLYNQYKVSKPFDVEPMNEQAELLTYLDAYCFAAHDLNLYLDNNPEDQDMIRLFNEHVSQVNQLQTQYEQKYGPLFVDASNSYPWAWNDSPWPWENR